MLVFNRGNENVEVHSGSQRFIGVPMLVFNRVNENVEVHSGLQRSIESLSRIRRACKTCVDSCC